MSKVAVIVPCFKRPEYTAKCIKSLEEAQEYKDTFFYLVDDNSQDGTSEILEKSKFTWKEVVKNPQTKGLRNVIIPFFKLAKDFKYIVKVDNDCVVPKNWLADVVGVLDSFPVDIVSPNVYPSDAAHTYGKFEEGLPYRPAKIVGGLWAMRSSLVEDIYFEEFSINGIKGATHLLNQIILEKEPKVGWLTNVTFQDLGHWSGLHPEHIKSPEHHEYSVNVGRQIAWGVE